MVKCKIVASFRGSDGKIRHPANEVYECSEAEADKLIRALCLKPLPQSAPPQVPAGPAAPVTSPVGKVKLLDKVLASTGNLTGVSEKPSGVTTLGQSGDADADQEKPTRGRGRGQGRGTVGRTE